jgi:hypothetical protein
VRASRSTVVEVRSYEAAHPRHNVCDTKAGAAGSWLRTNAPGCYACAVEALTRVAERLDDQADVLVDQQIERLRSIASYARVPEDDLRRSAHRNVARVVAVLSARTELPTWVAEDERRSGRRRALQGIPSDDVVSAYRLALGSLRDSFLTEADRMEIPLEAVVLGMRRLWDITDRYSSELVMARHQFEIDVALRSERERLSFLHNALTGALRGPEIEEGGAAHGLRPGRRFHVLRARGAADADSAEDLLLRLRHGTAGHGPSLLGPFGSDVAGAAEEAPSPVPGALVAVAGPVGLGELPVAFAEATRLLDVGAMFEAEGLVTAETLSLRVAVAHEDELGEMLYRRYVAPVHETATIAGDLLRSVEAYLDGRRSVTTAARALTVHANTLRYRIERFESITAADLRDTVTALEVWWALQYARIRRR